MQEWARVGASRVPSLAGEYDGRNPTDCSELGCERQWLVDRRGSL